MQTDRIQIHRRIAWRLGLAVIVGITATLATAVPAGAEPTEPSQASSDEAMLAEEKRAQLIELINEGADDAEIKSKTGLVKVSTESGEVSPLSTNADVSTSTPTIYYDRGIGAYYAASDYRWNNQQTTGDGPNTGGNVGGYDAFSIRFTLDIVNYGTTISICPGAWSGATPYPSTKPACLIPGPSENSEDGAAYRYQDRTVGARCSGSDHNSCRIYVGANGTLVFTFKRLTAGCLQVFSQYAHTWSSTTISSISVSNSGFSVGFSSSSNRWQRTSQAGRHTC